MLLYPISKKNVVEYLEGGVSPFGKWFLKLDPNPAAKVTTALYRLGVGHLSKVKSIGKGVFEYKIDFGPGYRIYFGQDGNLPIILLGGGSKKSQNKDIGNAQIRWARCKLSKEI